MSDIAPTTKSETPSPSEESVCVTSDTPSQAPAPEAKNDEATAPPSSHPTSDIPHPTFLDSLAEALTSTAPHPDILKTFNLTRSHLSKLLDTTDLPARIESLERLQALEHKARITSKLRAAHESSLDKLLEHQHSDNATESRKAAQTLLRQTTAYLIALSRPTPRLPKSPSPRDGLGRMPSDPQHQHPGPEATSPTTQSPSSTPSLRPSVSTSLPPPPKPYSSPDLLFPHQINQLRQSQPKTPHDAFNAIYNNLDHPIKCITSLQTKLKNRIDASLILYHYNANYEDLGPASFDQEVLIPAPISPDLSRKPVLKHFAIKRYAFAREGQSPIYYRIHLAKQDPVPGETADRWALSDIAIDSS